MSDVTGIGTAVAGLFNLIGTSQTNAANASSVYAQMQAQNLWFQEGLNFNRAEAQNTRDYQSSQAGIARQFDADQASVARNFNSEEASKAFNRDQSLQAASLEISSTVLPLRTDRGSLFVMSNRALAWGSFIFTRSQRTGRVPIRVSA